METAEKETAGCEFIISCYGRDFSGSPALRKPVTVKVCVTQPGEAIISLDVVCQYNTGGHGQRCKASHPNIDKVGDGVSCPYSADIPYAFDKKIDLPRQGFVK